MIRKETRLSVVLEGRVGVFFSFFFFSFLFFSSGSSGGDDDGSWEDAFSG